MPSLAPLKEPADALTADPARREPRPFLFNFPSVDRRNRALISVDGSDFSRGVSFDTLGAENAFSMPSPRGDAEIHIGMKIQEGLGAVRLFYLTLDAS